MRPLVITCMFFASGLVLGQTPLQTASASAATLVTVQWQQEMQLRISGDRAVYPQIAAAAHISGCVYLSTVISTDGSVEERVYLGGLVLMRDSAMKAVATWKFKPSEREVGTVVPVCYFLSTDAQERLLASYQETAEQVANDHAKLLSFGNELYLMGLTGQAEAQFRRALSLTPGDPEAGFGLGDSLAAEGRFDDAIVAYQQCLTSDPKYLSERPRFENLHRTNNNALLLYAAGEVYEKRGGTKDALRSYKAAMKLMPYGPDFREAYNRLGGK
ncbi:MAG: tetratricopeptide repeat protein [Candidatus Acidiferrales bacterium]